MKYNISSVREVTIGWSKFRDLPDPIPCSDITPDWDPVPLSVYRPPGSIPLPLDGTSPVFVLRFDPPFEMLIME